MRDQTWRRQTGEELNLTNLLLSFRSFLWQEGINSRYIISKGRLKAMKSSQLLFVLLACFATIATQLVHAVDEVRTKSSWIRLNCLTAIWGLKLILFRVVIFRKEPLLPLVGCKLQLRLLKNLQALLLLRKWRKSPRRRCCPNTASPSPPSQKQ